MSGETVLIVEDDDSLRMALAGALSSFGYGVIEAGTGGEALALVTRPVPDLVLLDLGLPDVDGLFVARKLKEKAETAAIAVAALTAEEISGARAEEVYKHCIGYIAKPVALDRLVQSVALFLKIGRGPAWAAETVPSVEYHPKRRHIRIHVEIGALCRFRGGTRQQGEEARVTGLVRNLGEGGLMLELPHVCGRGTMLKISLRIHDARLHPVVEVVWAGPARSLKGGTQVYRHGLRFIQMAQEERSILRRFIFKQLSR